MLYLGSAPNYKTYVPHKVKPVNQPRSQPAVCIYPCTSCRAVHAMYFRLCLIYYELLFDRLGIGVVEFLENYESPSPF